MANPRNPLRNAARPAHWTPHTCAGGLLAAADPGPSELTDYPRISRRDLLKGTGASVAAMLIASPGSASSHAEAPTGNAHFNTSPQPAATPSASPVASPTQARLLGYAFNARTQDVTIFDPANQQVLATKPLGATVRWLSNEQRFWDGRHIWTYDFPDNEVQAIAVDPDAINVARTIQTGGTGPAHSIELTPDRKTAWVNVAGDNYVAVLDVASGQVDAEIQTGAFPWDMHFTPDGRFGFVPERDQDTVSKIDVMTRQVVNTVTFPDGSRPYMLRVSPDGEVLWVQTGAANTNVVLDVESMETLHTEALGSGPVTCAFSPVGGRYGLVTHLQEAFVSALDQETGREVQRIDVGGSQANPSFTPDGTLAYVTVTSRDEVVAIDMTELAVIGRITTGEEPMGLVVFDPTTD